MTVAWIEARLRIPCPRTGHPFVLLGKSRGYGDRGPWGPSLDQRTPGAGYTKDNVEVVAWAYNSAKQRFTNQEVLDLCKAVVKTARSSSTSPVPPAEAVTP